MFLFVDKPIIPTLEDKIDQMLVSLLGSAQTRGKAYAKEAIKIYTTEYNQKHINMCVIFERIAKKYGYTEKSIATAISRYINKNWYSGDADFQDHIFSNTLTFRKPTPTPARFIAAVSVELSHSKYVESKKSEER